MKKVLVAMLLVVLALGFAVPAAPVAAWCGPGTHVVRYGETLFSIGRWYGVNPWSIARANGLYNPNYIYAGQRLYIPGCTGYTPPQPCYGWGCYGYHGRYIVRHGDTLSTIAWRHGVNMYTLAHVNGIYNLNHIYAGQVLVIP